MYSRITGSAAPLNYSARKGRRIAPSRSDCYIALFILIAVIAGMIGILGVVGLVWLWIDPASLGHPERPPTFFFLLGSVLYAGALALAFFAARLARRRLRPVDDQAPAGASAIRGR